ncbi:hypothetical protein KY290_036836 [Solanum tuberosum]|uniref:Uncharacterized protein n=1 Tax=Solanum tuberosum TaxID=4113 RepID=A0ABQ7TTU6_SOLTU|nr:hypothetical protein KY289_036306 [Solanum tuberosum]KAH0639567.1 hypothetical protein KY285_036153 [Solanum tuberosum]KAH0738131.1 hypothetical protein KY290_036836 [Solanum tuberosum]
MAKKWRRNDRVTVAATGSLPVLSAQFTIAATGRPSGILNLFLVEPPRPRFDIPTVLFFTIAKNLKAIER